MKTYISILRGINVSGHKKIKMDALRNIYDALKFKSVRTYIQSGNVIFKTRETDCPVLEKKIARKIAEEYNFDVPIMVKDLEELTVVIKNNPFVNKRKEDVSKLHVTFLSQTPEQANIDKIKSGLFTPDEFLLSGKTVYLFCPDGYGRTKLTNTFFENKLKIVATTRNWKTVNELVKMSSE